MISLKKYIQLSSIDKSTNEGIHLLQECLDTELSINEKFGAYDGQVELIDILTKFILKNSKDYNIFTLNKNDLSDFNNVFYKELIIYYQGKENSFDPDESDYLDKEELFDKIVIRIDPSHTGSYLSLAKALLHEFTHAWDDYNSIKSGSEKTLADLINDRRSKIRLKIQDIDFKNTNTNLLKKWCSEICYFLRKEEMNSFKSEVHAEIMNLKFSSDSKNSDLFLNYKDFQKIIENCELYNLCKYYLYKIQQIDLLSNEYKKIFSEIYNKINNTDYSFSKISVIL